MTTTDQQRKLTAILAADAVGYSRLMAEDEAATVAALNHSREIFRNQIEIYAGRVLDTAGDSVLADFSSPIKAVDCAVAIQRELGAQNASLPESRRMQFRIGVNLGDVIEGDGTVYGDGVNVAARLQALAEPGGINVSGTVFDHVEGKLPLQFRYAGEQQVKNIPKPVRVYCLASDAGPGDVVKRGRIVASGRRSSVLVIGSALLLLVVALSLTWRMRTSQTPRQAVSAPTEARSSAAVPTSPSIAVLSFDNLSDDPKQEYLSDGMAEDIITALSKVRNIFVIARNSSFQYKGKPIDVRKIAQELGVRYVLEGSVRRSGDQIRVTAQLVDAVSGNHLWAERFDRPLKDIFALQDEITGNIVTALDVEVVEGEQARMWRRSTTNMEAYQSFMRGREHLILLTREELAIARQHLERAIELDPKFGLAHTQLASYYLLQTLFGFSEKPKEDLKRALELQKKAIELDDSQGFSHAQLGRLYLFRELYDLEKARAEGSKAVALEPNGGESNAIYAFIQEAARNPQGCMTYINKALRLQPFPNPWYPWLKGLCLRHLGQFDEGIAAMKRALALSPDVVFIRAFLVELYVQAGRLEEARQEAKEVLRLEPSFRVDEFLKRWDIYEDRDMVQMYAANLRKAGMK